MLAALLLFTLSLAAFAEEHNESAAEQESYDPEDAALDHTMVAIAFAEAGDEVAAEQAFRAAVKHGRSVNTLVNLAVFLMRIRAILCEGCALELMAEARKMSTIYYSEESAAFVEDNWNALMKTMAALELEVPAKYQRKTQSSKVCPLSR